MEENKNNKKENKFKKLMIKTGKGLSRSFNKLQEKSAKFFEMGHDFMDKMAANINKAKAEKENKFTELMIKTGKGLSKSFDKLNEATAKFANMNDNFMNKISADINAAKAERKSTNKEQELLYEREQNVKSWDGHIADNSEAKKDIEMDKIALANKKMLIDAAIVTDGLLWGSSFLLKHTGKFIGTVSKLIKKGLNKGIEKAEQKQSERQKSESLKTLSDISTNDESLDNKKQDNKQKATSHNLSSITTSDDTMPIVARKTEKEQTNSR